MNLRMDVKFIPKFQSGYTASLLLFGEFSSNDFIALTDDQASCNYLRGKPSAVTFLETTFAKADIEIPEISNHYSIMYFCLKTNPDIWKHQGCNSTVSVVIYRPFIPFWMEMVLITICICLSSILSGLSLGLLALDITELRVISNSGTVEEKKNAQALIPIRMKGNILLCSILLGNTLANAVFTVLTSSYIEGWLAILVSTATIVVVIEIIPCSVVSRYGILIGAKTIWLTKAIMYITFPISYPLGKALDLILGKEISIYTKERIKEFLKITSEFTEVQKSEVDIITGTLDMSSRKVKEVMTPLDDVYMLPIEGYLDFDTVADLMKSGYSRIPIYEKDRSNIVSLIFTKDLAILDPEDKTEIKIVTNFYKHETFFIQENTLLNAVFKIFKKGNKGHMAFIYTTEWEVNGKKKYDTIGLVTLEDIFEEMIQDEIVDETDTVTDNKSKKRRNNNRMTDYITIFGDRILPERNVFVPPQLVVAAIHFLSSTVEPFKPHCISTGVLKLMMEENGVFQSTSRGMKNKHTQIFPMENKQEFIMILEGVCEVKLLKEGVKFEAGSFKYFGIPALAEDLEEDLKFEYTVEAIGTVKYMVITQEAYLKGKKLTNEQMETSLDQSQES